MILIRVMGGRVCVFLDCTGIDMYSFSELDIETEYLGEAE